MILLWYSGNPIRDFSFHCCLFSEALNIKMHVALLQVFVVGTLLMMASLSPLDIFLICKLVRIIWIPL